MARRFRVSGVSGNYQVKALRAAKVAAQRLFPKAADCMRLRAHALKLRYWPTRNPTDDSGHLLDLNWDWIKSLRGDKVGELRIDEAIAGRDNLRLIFFVADKRREDVRPFIWILHAMQKKRQVFTGQELSIFRARRQLIIVEVYGGGT